MDFRLDPYTGDYTLTSDGQFEMTDEIDNALYLCLAAERGSFFADPKMGSKLHLLKREKRVDRILGLAEAYTVEALQPLINRSLATSVSAVASWRGTTTTWVILRIEVVGADKRERRYEYFIKVR